MNGRHWSCSASQSGNIKTIECLNSHKSSRTTFVMENGKSEGFSSFKAPSASDMDRKLGQELTLVGKTTEEKTH